MAIREEALKSNRANLQESLKWFTETRQPNEPPVIFETVGKTISKRYEIIIILWIVGLVASVPFFALASKVTSSNAGVGNASGESQTVQNIIDSAFSSAGSGSGSGSGSDSPLFLVITSSNVTSQNVRSFVTSFANASKSDPSLSNLMKVATVYGSVTRVVSGAVSAIGPLRNGTAALTSLLYGVPDDFNRIWNATSGRDPAKIPDATDATKSALAALIKNQTQLAIAKNYLSDFTAALTFSYKSPGPTFSTDARVAAAINSSATTLINTFFPPSERPIALDVLHHFTLSNYADQAAVETFVVGEVAKITLYTSTFARTVYPLTSDPPAANETNLVESIIVNYLKYGLPTFYQNSVTGYVSPNQKVMIVVLNFNSTSDKDVTSVRSLVATQSAKFGLGSSVAVTGGQALSRDFGESSMQDLQLILPITIVILIAATGIFFRSVVTPAVSLMGIGIALGIANSVILYAVGTYVIAVDSNVPNILLTIIIGVGTDYSVFLLARYREERVRGVEKVQAVTNSVNWAGESIATSGLTVIISFLFLGMFQSVSLLKSMGFVVGAGVLVALAASLTLVPSMIMVVPNRVFWPNVGNRFAKYAEGVERSITNKSGYFSKSAKFSIKHAKLITVVAIMATVPATYVWATAPVGYDFLAAAPKTLDSVQAFNSISQNFGAGTLYPTYAVMQFTSPVWNGTGYNVNEMRAIDALSNSTLLASNVQSVNGPTRPGGQRVDFYNLGADPRSKLLENSINGMLSKNGTFALVNIDLVASPQSETSITTAQQLRTLYQSFVQNNSQYIKGVYLGGVAGSTLDSKNTINGQFSQVIIYVMIGVAAVLLLVLGSLFLPLFAIASIIMSIAWTIAATDIVFQGLYSFPILFITPLTLFVLLLGLGMDYNVFILTRIREEASKGVPLNTAITMAIERTGGIITAAAVILAGSLGALMLSNNLLLKEFGFAFFYSILIDAMIMRTYVVPSVMSLAGKWNWYAPGRLQRVKMVNAQTE